MKMVEAGAAAAEMTVPVEDDHSGGLYSLINVAGLAVGLASAILIMLFVRDELSYDKWIPDTTNSTARRSGSWSMLVDCNALPAGRKILD